MGGSNDGSAHGSHAAGDLPPRLADDEFYRALASSHRRRSLYYLLEHGESTVAELASVLSGWEATETGAMYTSGDRSAIRLQLLHSHLPQLAEAGLIAYDSGGDAVRLEELHPRVADVIRQSAEAERRRQPE